MCARAEANVQCKLGNMLPVLCTTTGIYTMVVVSVERVRCVLPARGHDVPTPATRSIGLRGTVVALAVVWTMSAVVAVPTAVNFDVGVVTDTGASNHSLVVCRSTWNSLQTYIHSLFLLVVSYLPPSTRTLRGASNHSLVGCRSTWNGLETSIYSLFLLVVSYLLPQVVLYINYGRLAAYLWRRRRAVRAQPQSIGPTTRHAGTSAVTPTARNTVRTIKMPATVAILFLAAWAPYFTIMTIEVIRILLLQFMYVITESYL